MDLDDALRVQGRNPGGVDAAVPEQWCINHRAHGGFLAALAERCCRATLGRDDASVRSITIHYLRGAAPGPVEADVTVEQSGRRVATVTCRMRQSGTPVLVGVASYAPPGGHTEYAMPGDAPVHPPAAGLARSLDVAYVPRSFLELVDVRLVPELPLFAQAKAAKIAGWAKLTEPRRPDVSTLLIVCDSFPRALMAVQDAPPRVAPPTTMLQMLVHEREIAARVTPSDHVLVELVTRRVHEGFFDEDSSIWSADGTLLAQTRQLAIEIV